MFLGSVESGCKLMRFSQKLSEYLVTLQFLHSLDSPIFISFVKSSSFPYANEKNVIHSTSLQDNLMNHHYKRPSQLTWNHDSEFHIQVSVCRVMIISDMTFF